MKTRKNYTGLYTLVAAALLAGPVTNTHADLTYTYLPGTMCKPANLDQAFDLEWNHYRVKNPSSGTADRWVVCPIANHYVTDSGGFSDQSWIGTYHEGNGDIYCIVRRYSDSQTTGAVPFQAQSITQTGPYPSGKQTTFSNANIQGFGAKTMTCRLSPGTGINQVSSAGAT